MKLKQAMDIARNRSDEGVNIRSDGSIYSYTRLYKTPDERDETLIGYYSGKKLHKVEGDHDICDLSYVARVVDDTPPDNRTLVDIYDVLQQDMCCMVGDGELEKLAFYAADRRFFMYIQKYLGHTSALTAWATARPPTVEEAPLFERIPYHPSWGQPEGLKGCNAPRVLVRLADGYDYISDVHTIDWDARHSAEVQWYMILKKQN